MCVVKKQRTIYAGVAELADALDLGSSVSDMQVRPLSPAPKNGKRKLVVFLSIAKAMVYHHTKRASHHRRCISSAQGCIFFRNDDIQGFTLMIFNFLKIDDIHAKLRDLMQCINVGATIGRPQKFSL